MSKNFWLIVPVVVYIIIMGSLFFVLVKQESRTIRIDCTWSEISPDFSPKMKEECRKVRSGRL